MSNAAIKSSDVKSFDVEAIRADFPTLHQQVSGHDLVYLDNGASTQKPQSVIDAINHFYTHDNCLLYTSPSPRDATLSRMPSSA